MPNRAYTESVWRIYKCEVYRQLNTCASLEGHARNVACFFVSSLDRILATYCLSIDKHAGSYPIHLVSMDPVGCALPANDPPN